MSYCLNSDCPKPRNPKGHRFCQSCGSPLLLGDRYRALKPIAEGGFGRTFLAVDEYKPSQSFCVIKQFIPFKDPATRQKATELFRREAMQLDELGKHPQIPELFAHFEQNQRQYLVQEFINGLDFDQELKKQGAFNEEQIRQLLLDLLPLLQFIHDRNVIHRDIKPENILRRSSDDRLFLVDFGASKVVRGTSFGQGGTTIGSAGYIAPEQLQGKAFPASDLYSLGVTCIHLLTQVEPFELLDMGSNRWKWRDYLPTPISEPLGEVLDKLLQTSLKQRYKTADEVLQTVRDLPTVPSPDFTPPPANPSPLNRLLGGIPQVILGQLSQEFGNADAAIAAFDRALAINPNNPKTWYKKANLYYSNSQYQDAIYCYQKTLELQPENAESWKNLGHIFYQLKRMRDAVESYLKSLELQPNQPEIWLCLGVAVKQLGEDAEARRCLRKAQLLLPSNPEIRARLLWTAWETLLE